MSDVSGYTILPAASPDATPLVDLSIYDLDASAIYAQALANVQAAFPDWTPLAGNTEVVVLQAIALAAAELGYAINRLPLSILQALAGLFGVAQQLGLPPWGTISVTFSDTLGHFIPMGTLLSYMPGGQLPIYFSTANDLNISAGASVGTVNITGTTSTSAANGLAIGTTIALVPGGITAQSVVTTTAISGGVDPETTQAWLTRAAGVLQASTNTYVTPPQFVEAALDQTGVFRAAVLDNFQPSYTTQWGATSGASVLGNVTVAVWGQGSSVGSGTAVANATKTALQTALQLGSVAGLGVNVIDACTTTVGASVSARAAPGWQAADVVASVTDTLATWLDTDSWAWGDPVRILDAYNLCTQAAGVSYVTSVALSSTTAGASVVSGASVGSPITLAAPANLLPVGDQSFETAGAGNWGASYGWGLTWPWNQSGNASAASTSVGTTWTAGEPISGGGNGTKSLAISYPSTLGASVNPSLWVTCSLSGASVISTVPGKTYTVSAVANFSAGASTLAAAYGNQLVWLVTDSNANQYTCAVSMTLTGNIATYVGTFTANSNAGNITSLTLFLMAGYATATGWVNGPVYLDNIGVWAGAPAAAWATYSGGVTTSTTASGFTYSSEPPIISSQVAGDILLGGIPQLALATLGNVYVQVG